MRQAEEREAACSDGGARGLSLLRHHSAVERSSFERSSVTIARVYKLLAVCVGGALGSGARYLVSLLALRFFGASFPVGTLVVNVLGSVLLGALIHLSTRDGALSPALKLLLTAGFCGGFTTYSTFNLESLQLIEDGRLGLFALYAGATFLLCLGLGFLSLLAARSLWPS